jgi:hypothetical protein
MYNKHFNENERPKFPKTPGKSAGRPFHRTYRRLLSTQLCDMMATV